nr:cation diffusion facilitator family transporter [Thermoactinomyces sp. CICC 24226]
MIIIIKKGANIIKSHDYHHLNHVKQQPTSKTALWITLCLTLFFTIVEIVGGLLSNSLALLSDSAHMISDVIALGLSLTAVYLAARKPDHKYTFGFIHCHIFPAVAVRIIKIFNMLIFSWYTKLPESIIKLLHPGFRNERQGEKSSRFRPTFVIVQGLINAVIFNSYEQSMCDFRTANHRDVRRDARRLFIGIS